MQPLMKGFQAAAIDQYYFFQLIKACNPCHSGGDQINPCSDRRFWLAMAACTKLLS
jgi:hypothetical protein